MLARADFLDNSAYNICRLLDDDDLVELKEIFEKYKPEYFHQLFNLFDVERRSIPRTEALNYTSIRKICNNEYSIDQMLTDVYFLRYREGSFARVHRDSGTSRTIITYVENENLVGGDTIMKLEYKRKPRPKDKKNYRSQRENEKPPYGSLIRNVVVPFEVGESVIYGPSLLHGVGEVLQGSRIILACWFKPIDSFGKKEKK